MAKKSSKSDFANNPFKPLKGLSVSAPEPAQNPPEPARPAGAGPQAVAGDDFDFSAEMEFLGVRRMVDGNPSPAVAPPSAESEPLPADDDSALFQAALGKLDTVFRDEWPEPEPPPAAPRRLKQVEQGRLRIEAELDLHGLSRVEAVERTGFFLGNARHQGWQTVLIITGKGVHSEQGPVLREAVENCLRENSESVVEWGQAPRRFGGSGALVVFLRRS